MSALDDNDRRVVDHAVKTIRMADDPMRQRLIDIHFERRDEKLQRRRVLMDALVMVERSIALREAVLVELGELEPPPGATAIDVVHDEAWEQHVVETIGTPDPVPFDPPVERRWSL